MPARAIAIKTRTSAKIAAARLTANEDLLAQRGARKCLVQRKCHGTLKDFRKEHHSTDSPLDRFSRSLEPSAVHGDLRWLTEMGFHQHTVKRPAVALVETTGTRIRGEHCQDGLCKRSSEMFLRDIHEPLTNATPPPRRQHIDDVQLADSRFSTSATEVDDTNDLPVDQTNMRRRLAGI
jgi:hypothetical protein